METTTFKQRIFKGLFKKHSNKKYFEDEKIPCFFSLIVRKMCVYEMGNGFEKSINKIDEIKSSVSVSKSTTLININKETAIRDGNFN